MSLLLKVVNDEVKAFASLEALQAITGSTEPDSVIENSAWEESGQTAYISDGNIILGKPSDVVTSEAEDYVRRMRHKLLKINCDRISPMRWELLTTEQQDAVRAYRQALLDITKKDGFPWVGKQDEIPWPTVPEFIGDEYSRGITSLD